MWDVPETDTQVPIVCGTNIDIINDEVMDVWKMDVCIAMFDIWALRKPLKRMIPWIPIDTQNVSEKIIQKVSDCPMQIAMTRHGESELRKAGLEPEYAPIGFDPDVFYPDQDKGLEFRDALPWKDGLKADEMFLLGTVGLNYPGDRKGFIILMQAFKKFHENRPEARLYIHTQACKQEGGMNYGRIANEIGIMDYIAWADPAQFWFAGFTHDDLRGIYSAMDLFCLPTHGEGFGIPAMEAQACGTPVVITDNTSGSELCKTGALIPTDADDFIYTGLNTWRKQPKPSKVQAAIIGMYSLRDRYDAEATSESVSEYHWDTVGKNHWQPIIDKIETMLPITEEGDEDARSEV